MESIRFGNNDIVQFLLKKGASKKAMNKQGQTALDIAKQSKNTLAVKLLNQI